MNTLGTLFRITTWGESHGKALGVVIDGCPPGIEVNEDMLQVELDRRKPGQSSVTTSRGEADTPKILSGVFEGVSTGHPISVLVWNKDADSSKYNKLKDVARPGHADFSYRAKYGIRDHRGGGRSSGRETVARVIAGAVAKQILKQRQDETKKSKKDADNEGNKIQIIAYAKQIGTVVAKKVDVVSIEKNDVRTADLDVAEEMKQVILDAKEEGDSVGGIIEVIVKNCPVGLGAPVFRKLKADLASAMLSIGAVTGFAYGAGFDAVALKGSEMNDAITKDGFATNNHGGILGGISTGEDIVFQIAVKPTASILKKQKTVNASGEEQELQVDGRHDPCLVPRIVPVVDNMVAVVLADHLLMARNG